MNYDGWVVIGTDLNSKEFDKEIKRLKKESEKLAKEEEKLLNQKAKLELDTSKTMNELSKVDKKIELISKKINSIEASNIPENLENNISYQKLIADAEQLNIKGQEYASKLDLQKTNLNNINQKLIENATNQDMIKNKLEETEAKSLGLHMSFDNIGKSIWDNVKKIGKWAGAVFGIRAAYNAVSQAMSIISGYNDGINNKLYSMKMMFASALEPLITRIVNLAWKLMSYVAYILKAWFGIDILAKASANSMKASAKSAKEMKKDLMGFDEANIQNKDGSVGSIGANSTPSFEMPNVEIPSWVKWIADNKDKILTFLKTFATILGVVFGTKAIINFLSKLKLVRTVLDFLNSGITNIMGLLKGMSGLQIFALIAGVALTITGITTAISGLIAFIKDPSWDNFNRILQGLTLTLLGVGTAMVALNATNPVGWITLAAGAATGLVTICSTLAKTLFEDKANILSVKDAREQLKQAQDNLKQSTENLTSATKNYDDAVKNAEEATKKLEAAEKKNKISGEELFNQVADGKLKYQDMNTTQKEVYNAYLNNLDAQEKLKNSTEELENSVNNYKAAKEEETNVSWKNQLTIAKESGKYEEFRDKVIQAYEDGSLKAGEARDYIERAMIGMSDASKKTFTQDLPDDIKNGLDPNRYESLWTKFKNAWNSFWGKLNKNISVAVNGTFNGASSFSSNSGGSGFAKGGIYYPKIQYHASGGIINQPGRGVPLMQHIGGEAGPEGILPLTDSQQMELLGQSIARYMVINLTNINQMNSRTISRELKRIESQQDFAANR